MTLIRENERLAVEQERGVVYSLPLHKRRKGGAMIEDQSGLVTLLEKIRLSDEMAMSGFYDATVGRVYGMAMKVVQRSELAEEVVGDVYMQVWRQVNNYKVDRASPIGWLLMICRSRALDILRREKSATRNQFHEGEEFEIEDDTVQHPLEQIMNSETSRHVSAAIQLLSNKQREAISLAFYRGMSHQEISEYTGSPLGTVKTNIRRAHDILRNILHKDELSIGEFYGKA